MRALGREEGASSVVLGISSRAANRFQSRLTTAFVLLVWTIMCFFLFRVFISIAYVLLYKGMTHYMSHRKNKAETFAFLFSILALSIISYPRIRLLYAYRAYTRVGLIVKVVGAQWYWTYEISDLFEDEIFMYMLPLDEISVGEKRFLEVDNRLVLPTGLLVQFNVTSRDVIHRFALPTMGAKVDAVAGLLRVVPVHTRKVGVHYGQCREICGMNHAFMPFCLEVTTMPFLVYLRLEEPTILL